MNSNHKNRLSQQARDAIFRRDWQTLGRAASAMLQEAPHDAETLFLAGVHAKSQQEYALAIDYFRRGLEIDPERHDLTVELASQLMRTKEHSEAHGLLVSAGARLSNSPYYSDMAATTFIGLGLPSEALPHAKNAYDLQPEVDLFAGNLASCCGFVGETARAVELYESLLAKRPGNRRNHYFLSKLRKAVDHSHIDVMKGILSDDPESDSRNIFLLFALGKECEDLALWADAFSWYQRGCRAAASLRPDGLDLELEKLRAGASRPVNRATRGPGEQTLESDYQPVFIVGLPRSGSTLVERALANHTQVQSVGETRYFEQALEQVFGDIPSALSEFSACDPEQNAAVANAYIEALRFRLGPESTVIEKLPLNFNFVPAIASAFPQASFIYTHREPEAACFSMYKQLFGSECLFSYDLEDVAHYFTAHSEFRAQFAKELPERWIEISYEQLVAEPHALISALLERLSLPIEAACFNPETNSSASMTASATQVRAPIHKGASQIWRNFKPHLQPMLTALAEGMAPENASS